MATTRTTIELEALRAEAERRVRLGESRADVARALDVAATTLSQWALRGRWRKKDIEAERGGELKARADEMIAKLRGKEAATLVEAKRTREEAAKLVAEAVAGRAAAEAARTAAEEEAEAAREELRVLRRARDEGGVAASAREEAGGPLRHPALPDATSPAFGEGGQVLEVEPVEVAMRSMAKAQKLMGEDKLEEAERAARVAWRMLSTAERMDQREERLQARFDERIEAAAGAAKSAVTPGVYPDRDPANYAAKIERCFEVVRRVAFLERGAPGDVERTGTMGFGFVWPGAEAPWFQQGCMKGRLSNETARPVWKFDEAWPGQPRELTLTEKAELEMLRGFLARWRTEVDPFCREMAIEGHRARGSLAMARREWPKLWRGLAPVAE